MKDDIGLIITSLLSGVGVFFSWLYQSSLLGTLTGVAIGAGLTYFVQTRTQNKIWKRDYAVKLTELVYSGLFGEIKGVTATLQDSCFRPISGFVKWAKIQNDYRYFMVDERFKEKLDSFLLTLNEYNVLCNRIEYEIIPSILKQNAKAIFEEKPEDTPQMPSRL